MLASASAICYNLNVDLFDYNNNTVKAAAPLAERVRPKTLSEYIGQSHLVAPGALLYRAIKADRVGSCIFFGPPGTGKTTLAQIIASSTKSAFVKLNAVSSGVSDAKKVIEEAKDRLKMYGKRTYLLLDECHRWSKAQSDCVLGAIEDGSIIFIGSTTENPYISMTRAIVSRCRVFELKPLTKEEIIGGLKRALKDTNGLLSMNVILNEDAADFIALSCGGDLRNALNALELGALTSQPDSAGKIVITKEVAAQSIQRKNISLDESGFYDMLSAFCKSLRGSDADAALYWAFRLVASGADPLTLFRRMIAHASEDVGMADSTVLSFCVSAMNAYEKIGMPEGELTLAHAIIYLCRAPKSNAVYLAKEAAKQCVEETGESFVPLHLRNNNNSSLDKSDTPYKYPHDYGGYVKQDYLPESLIGTRFYYPTDNGQEKEVKEFYAAIKKLTENDIK